MKFPKLIPILFIFFGNIPYKNLVFAEVKDPKDFKVLSNSNKKLSISNVEYFIKQGDKLYCNDEYFLGNAPLCNPFQWSEYDH